MKKAKTIRSYTYFRNGKAIHVKRHKRHYNYADVKPISRAEAIKIMERRSRRSQLRDNAATSKHVYQEPNTKWAKNPGQSDVVGIDTKDSLLEDDPNEIKMPAELENDKTIADLKEVRCKGITSTGKRCKRMTKNPLGYCPAHEWQQNQSAREKYLDYLTTEQLIDPRDEMQLREWAEHPDTYDIDGLDTAHNPNSPEMEKLADMIELEEVYEQYKKKNGIKVKKRPEKRPVAIRCKHIGYVNGKYKRCERMTKSWNGFCADHDPSKHRAERRLMNPSAKKYSPEIQKDHIAQILINRGFDVNQTEHLLDLLEENFDPSLREDENYEKMFEADEIWIRNELGY